MIITIIASPSPDVVKYVSMGYGHGQASLPLDANGNVVRNHLRWYIQFDWNDGGRSTVDCNDLYDACRKLNIFSERVMTPDTATLVNNYRNGYIG